MAFYYKMVEILRSFYKIVTGLCLRSLYQKFLHVITSDMYFCIASDTMLRFGSVSKYPDMFTIVSAPLKSFTVN